jgi:hypothetical protein
MRTLKFRYWDSGAKAFVYSGSFRGATNLQNLTRFFDAAEKYSDGKIQQFTGFEDKECQEIYEGDILKTGTLQGEVKMITGSWEFDCFYLNAYVKECSVVIVGNVFENPELLK